MKGRKAALPDILAVGCLVAGFVITVVKARIMAFTCDECFNFLLYAQKPLHYVLTHYDANNQVIDTLLSRECGLVFGLSEFSLRLPNLLGRLIFLWAVWLLARDLIRSRYVRLALVATLSFQPFLLDFGALHRGYSLALGLFMLGLWAAVRILEGRPFLPRFLVRRASPVTDSVLHLIALSILLGLSAGTVPLFVNISVPLCLFLLVTLWIRWGKEAAGAPPSLREHPVRRLWILLATLALPAAWILCVCYAGFFPTLNRGYFYIGLPTPWSSLRNLYECVFYYDGGNHFLFPNALIDWLSNFFLHTATSVAILVIWIALVAAALLWERDRRFVFITFTMIAAAVVAVLERVVLGFKYPVDRTGIYFMALFLLIGFLAFDNLYARLKGRNSSRRLRLAVTLAATVPFLLFFSVQVSKISLNYVMLWHRNAGVRPAMQALKRYVSEHADIHSLPRDSVSIDATDWLYQEVQFYRIQMKMDWIAPLGLANVPALKDGRQFYIVTPDKYQKMPPHTPLTVIAEFPAYSMKLYKGVSLSKNPPKVGG